MPASQRDSGFEDVDAWARAEKEWLTLLIANVGDARAVEIVLREIDLDTWKTGAVN